MKNKRLLSLVLAFAMLITLLVPLAVTTVSADEPTLITDQASFVSAIATNSVKDSDGKATGKFKLANDITISGTWSFTTAFRGELDGDGHTITFANGATVNGGLFQVAGANAYIHDLQIAQVGTVAWTLQTGLSGSVNACLGGVVGLAGAGAVNGTNSWGNESFVSSAANKVRIENVTVTVNMNVTGSAVNASVGGIVGEVGIYTEVTNCTFNGYISDATNRYVNGNTDSYSNQGSNTVRSAYGGMVGFGFRRAVVIITECINNGNISGYGQQGGILGIISPAWNGNDALKTTTIQRCINTGAITCNATTSTCNAGGIAGFVFVKDGATATVSNCINNGMVTTSGSARGAGIVGDLRRPDTANNFQFIGNLQECSSFAGSQIAHTNYGSGTVVFTNNYGCGAGDSTYSPLSDAAAYEAAYATLNAAYPGVYAFINNKVTLKWFVSNVLQSITDQASLAAMYENGNYKLVNDITISGTWDYSATFTGTLDGGGHTITIANGATITGGLFRQLSSKATVKNLNIVQAGSATYTPVTPSGSGAYCVGVLAASIEYPDDCNNTAITAAVENTVKIQNVNVTANLISITTIDNNKGYAVGGIIGEIGMITSITNCTFNGSISDVSRTKVDGNKFESGYGGIVGVLIRNGGTLTINKCINNASITGYASEGGILGHAREWGGGATAPAGLTIEKCINNGTITGLGTNNKASVGGIAGYVYVKNGATAVVRHCINTGAIASSLTSYAGGIVGAMRRNGTNFQFIGNLQESDTIVGAQIAQTPDGSGNPLYENNYGRDAGNSTYTALPDTAAYEAAYTTLNAAYPDVYAFVNNKVTLKWTVSDIEPITDQAGLAAMSENGKYKLENDITITGSWTYATAFTGTLDGDGHTITFADGATVNGGLFKTLNQGATIKNLNIAAGNGVTWKPVADAAGSGSPCVGGVAASAEAGNVGGVNKWGDTDFVSNPANTITVQNVTVTANIAISGSTGGDDKVAGGGIIGEIGIISLIKDCVFSGSISDGTRSKVDMVGYESGYGGIIGVAIRNGGPVQLIECINNGNVSGYGQEGGILGYSRAWGSGTTGLGSLIIEKCINNGTITCQRLSVDDTHYATVGGIAGYIYVKNNGTATLLNNVNNGDVIALATSGDSYASGIVGILRRGTANTVTLSGNVTRYDAVTTNGTVGKFWGKPDGQGNFSNENNVAFGATPSGVSAAWAVLNEIYPGMFVIDGDNKISLTWVNNRCAYLDESNYRQLFSLALDGMIQLRIGVAVPGDIPGSLRLIVSKGGSELQNVSMADAYDAESGYYVVSAPILAKEMADSNTYTVTVRNGDQTLWTTNRTISVKAYAEALLSHSEYSDWHDLMRAMLKYGAAAQNLFDYHTGTPAADISGGITVDTASLPSHTVTGDRSFLTNIRASLSLEAGTDLNFYFKPKTPGANLTATVEKGGVVVSGGVITEWVGEDGGASDVYFAVRIRNLAADQLDDWYDITVTDGSKSITVHYSGLCWVKAALDGDETAATKTLAKGIALYANKAIASTGNAEPIVVATPDSASSYYISYPAGADAYLKSTVLSFAEKMSRNGIYFATSSGDNNHLGKPIKIITNGSITGWTITFDTNANITVTGKDHLMAINGFRYLVDVMMMQTASGSYIIADPTDRSDTASAYTRSGWLLAAPAYENGTLASALYDEGTGLATDKDTTVNAERSYAMYIRSTTSAHFAAYESKLVSNGYTLDASSSATAKSNGSNLFRTYRRGTQAIFLYFDATNGVARVIDDQASTPETEFEYTFSYNSNTATDLILYGMKYNSQGLDPTDSGGDASTPNSGAFIIIKQADNSIMLIDGGIYLQATDAAVDALWNYLHTITGKAANETITISCWYITHPHLDHYYMVSALIEKYHENLDLQRVMFNFPKYVNDKGYEENTRTVARAYYPDVMFMKCHTGQSIQLGSLTLDVLATHEDLVTASSGTVSFGEGNDMSTVLRITFPDGSRYMSMGDATEGVVSGMIGRLAASELSCKFFEVPHHGYNELTSAQCNAFAPKYVFFPNAIYTNFPSNYGNSYRWRYTHSKNNHDRLQSAGATNFYYAGSGTYRLTVQNGGVTVTSTAVVY